jgi:two-component system, sensor histidine kinase YesM
MSSLFSQSRFMKFYYDMSIRTKLTLSYIFVVFLPVLLVGILLTYNLRASALENATNVAKGNVDRVVKRMEDMLKEPSEIYMRFASSSQLENILTENYSNNWDVINNYYNYDQFDELKNIYTDAEDMRIYVTNNSLIDNWKFMKVDDEIRNTSWYKDAVRMNGKIMWKFMEFPGTLNYKPGLCFINALKTISGKNLGILVVKLKTSEFEKILSQESFDAMLTDEKGNILASRESKRIGKNLTQMGISISKLTQDGISDVIFNGNRSKMISSTFNADSTSQKFNAISIFALNDIMGKAKNISYLGFGIIIGSLVLSLGLILIFSRAMGKRIGIVGRDMHRVALGDFDFVSDIHGNDEIGRLSSDMNKMVLGIKKLVHEVYETNLQKNILEVKQKEIKLKMLASQINPHFLFNALEAVRMEAVSNKQLEIARIVKLLGKIMRSILKISGERIPLSQELDLVCSYLEIQKFRYSDKLNYRIGFANDSILQQLVLPLIIQPVVENAVIHGIERKEDPGTIFIDFIESAGKILIRVSDDGVGIDSGALDLLLESLSAEYDKGEDRGIGLRNINQRIKLFYGDEYGIAVRSRNGSGTEVDVTIPLEVSGYAEGTNCR